MPRAPHLTALIIRTSLEANLTAALIYKGLVDVGYTNQEIAEGFLFLLEESPGLVKEKEKGGKEDCHEYQH